MSRETDFQTRMEADAPLMAILTGGVYVAGELGREGITRTSAPSAFDSNGYLKPCALVRQRSQVSDSQVIDQIEQIASETRIIEIYLYEDSGYTNIDSALSRLFTLFFGYQFSNGGFPLEWIGTLDRERDQGALDGASLARQEWLLANVIGD